MFTINELEAARANFNELAAKAARLGHEADRLGSLEEEMSWQEIEYGHECDPDLVYAYEAAMDAANQASDAALAALALVEEIESELDSVDDLTARGGRIPFWG